MQINYDQIKIEHALNDFTRATGINVQLLKPDFSTVQRCFPQNGYCAEIQSVTSGRCACAESDRSLLEKCRLSRKAEIHVCHAGLADVAIPLLHEQEIVAYLILGQMKTNPDFCEIKSFIKELDLNSEKMEKRYEMLALFDTEKIKSVANVAVMLAKYLLFENTISLKFNSNIQNAVEYINSHLDENLLADVIMAHGNISKNALYKGFKTEFGMTVHEYVRAKRIEKAEALLKFTDMSIEDIASATGFSTSAYFGLNFKKLKGISPLKYRKKGQEYAIQ